MKKKSKRFLNVFFPSVILALFCTFTLCWFLIGTLVHFFPMLFIRKWMAFIGLFLPWLLVGCLITRFFQTRLFKPIGKLNRAAKEIADGNFHVRLEDATNITEVQEMTMSFNQMAAELESTEIVHNDFTRNVSHEFKTPLSVIKGYARMMQKEQLDDRERLRYAELIIEGADRLTSLTNNILLLSKLENQQIQLEQRMLDIAEQIRKVLLLYETQWNKKNLELEIDMPERLFIKGNEGLLFQVWQNLIGNAVKFSKPNGHIRIWVVETPEHITANFQDDGIGISAEDQKRIFEKFYQADHSHAGAGNGLGLPLTKRITELHGGTVTVQSEEGNGSTFTVKLPKLMLY